VSWIRVRAVHAIAYDTHIAAARGDTRPLTKEAHLRLQSGWRASVVGVHPRDELALRRINAAGKGGDEAEFFAFQDANSAVNTGDALDR
jgi:hypothetical protein